MHRNSLSTGDLSNTKFKRRATFHAKGAPLKQRLRTAPSSRASDTPDPIVATTPQPIPAIFSNTRSRSHAPRASITPTSTSTTQPVSDTNCNTRSRTPRAVPAVNAFGN